MKILFTGGGTGGHFYPIIAVAEAIDEIVQEEKIIEPELFYMGPDEYDARALYDHGITFKKVNSGKVRNYFSILNFLDIFKTIFGLFKTLPVLYSIMPDIIFSKGGYASFPILFWARVLRIPIIIHESDTIPGRVNAWSAKFAKKIAVAWPEASKFFPADKVAYTGNPIRKSVLNPIKNGAHEYLNLKREVPTIFIIGGSQGARKINETIIDILPEILEKYQVIHQTGLKNFDEIKKVTDVVLRNNPNIARYKPFAYLNELAIRMSAGACDIVVSRAGSSIFEIASWGIPSIIIPIPEDVSRDQTSNALAYARVGGCIMIEENNLTPHILLSEIDRLISNQALREKMSNEAINFAKNDAGKKIAKAILSIALEHEK